MIRTTRFGILGVALAFLTLACASSPVVADGRASAYLVLPAEAGPVAEVFERFELDACAASLFAIGRVEYEAERWSWTVDASVPYRELGRTELRRAGAWVLVEVEIQAAADPAGLPYGMERTVRFSLDELLASPYGTRSPALHAAFMTVSGLGAAPAAVRVLWLRWNERTGGFEAGVRVAR
ncbi:MAG: hypothetical protein JXA15_06670 [Spirochaetales bacterium]|nr:hypothetical protein [Spirochaetales bacterium]